MSRHLTPAADAATQRAIDGAYAPREAIPGLAVDESNTDEAWALWDAARNQQKGDAQ